MRQCQERDALQDAIVEYLRDHQGLRELNARRRQARLKSEAEEETSAVIQALIRADPSLAALFGKGEKIKVPRGPVPRPEPYVGKQFPTFFRIAHEPRGGLVKSCPLNLTCRVEFETDAANDYFSRSTDPGRLEIRGAPRRVGSVHLWNGKAVLRFAPPPGCNPGDRLQVTVCVSDVSRPEPFESRFVIEVEPEAPPAPPGPPSPAPGASLTGLPNIIEVRQDQWALHGFDETTALELKSGEDDTIDMYINMDNLHLRNEIARRRTLDPDLLRYWFKYGLCLLTLGMLYQYRQSRREGAEGTNQGANGDENEGEVFSRIAEAAKGLAVTVIPAIAQLGKGKTEGST